MNPERPRDGGTPTLVSRWILLLLLTGMVGTGVELLLIEHYEDAWQIVPLSLIALGSGAVVWHGVTGGSASFRALRIVMGCFLLAGAAGLVLHFRGNLEFQLEIDASQSRWMLFRKVMRAKAPPALAPTIMAQLGLLGLLYAHVTRPLTMGPGPDLQTQRTGAHQTGAT